MAAVGEPLIYDGVELGAGCCVGPFCVIGEPHRGTTAGERTVIGEGAVIRSHTVLYAGNRIGGGFQTGHGAFVRECNSIGESVSIGTKSIVEHHVVICDRVRIHSQVFVPEYCHLGAGCWLGPNVVLTNARYPLSPNAKRELRGVIVEEGAIIGANATVLPGVRIGRRALVGAGSVVTRDVPEGAVVVGNPARIVNSIDKLPYGEVR